MKTAGQRTSNFELLRIISMCGIIAIHYANSEIGGAAQNVVFPNFSWMYVHFVGAFCTPLVNCFVLISGYFLIERKALQIRKAINLICITAFYGAASYLIAMLCTNQTWSVQDFVYAVIPFFKGTRWFVETYIILILLAPFLNKALRSLSKQSFEILLAIQISIFSIWYSIGLSAPVLDDGYGIINFITLYMLGGYIKMYGRETKIYQLRRRVFLSAYIAMALLTFLLSYFTNPYGYAYITNVLGATACFILFAKWNMGQNRLINWISGSAFDVYFVHSDKTPAFC